MTSNEGESERPFLWGASTAAHQIEGNNVNSDWWVRENAPDRGHISEPSLDAADSYHRYGEDMRLLADAGLTAYRFSIEWARIEPEPGLVSRAQLLHYRRMVDTARALGLEPVVTLHHFTNPRWFADRGGWLADDAVERFRTYVQTALPVIDGVRYVCTFNEPNMTAVLAAEGAVESLQAGLLPPGHPAVSATLAAAHAAARDVLRPAGHQVGWTVANQAFQAEPGAEQAMAEYAASREDYFLDVARDDDWLGVQSYTRTVIGVDGRPRPVPDGVERTLTGWEYYPDALGEAVRHSWQRTGGVPMLVTENGIATGDDERRIAYTAAALQGLQAAMDDGADVRGYLHWSALDNYEWGSYRPTFGLIGWDRETFARQPKPSLGWLGRRAREHAEHGRLVSDSLTG
ncbi:MAG: family 1 glycosylhydrolase [Propionibacteriaceae bacterium]